MVYSTEDSWGKKFVPWPQFHSLSCKWKSLVNLIYSVPAVARLPTSLQAIPKRHVFLHSQEQYIEKKSTGVPFSSGLQPVVGPSCSVLLLLF